MAVKHNPKLYDDFSRVYDQTMNEVPYLEWASYLESALARYGVRSRHAVLDIGCGTGILLRYLSSYFPRIMGLDMSTGMLAQAQLRTNAALVQGDMKNLPFRKGTFQAVFSTHDCINYMRTEKNLSQHFDEVSRILGKNGVYIFDVSTEKNVKKYYHNRMFDETHDDIRMIWKNTYNPKTREIASVLDFGDPGTTGALKYFFGTCLMRVRKFLRFLPLPFAKHDGDQNEDFMKITGWTREVHLQTIFPAQTIEDLLHDAGFIVVEKTRDYKEMYGGDLDNANLAVYVCLKSEV